MGCAEGEDAIILAAWLARQESWREPGIVLEGVNGQQAGNDMEGVVFRRWCVSAGLDNSCFLKAAPNCIACIFSSNEQASSLLGRECAGSGMR